jgi:hypothetical protein
MYEGGPARAADATFTVRGTCRRIFPNHGNGHLHREHEAVPLRGRPIHDREKELALKAWVRFLKHGLQREDFTKRLYEHIHCGFIAHYNRQGFYDTYFENGKDTVQFLSQFDKRGECRSGEYGGTTWQHEPYADLQRAMIGEAAPFIPELMEAAQERARESDLAQARALAEKHGRELR